MGFGTDLPNQVETVNEYATESLKLFMEVRDYMKERAALETEYAEKLEKLNHASTKRIKKFPALLYGPAAKSFAKKDLASPDDWRSEDLASFLQAWLTSLYQGAQSAQRRMQMVTQWNDSVIEPMKVLCTQSDEIRRKHLAFTEKLHSDVSKAFGELDKSRSKYEDTQKKASSQWTSYGRALTEDRASDKEKMRKYSEQVETDRVQLHNDYVLSMLYANAMKQHYYSTSMPAVLDEFQQLMESSYSSVISFLAMFFKHEKMANGDFLAMTEASESQFLTHVAVAADSELFIKHHRPVNFMPPADALYDNHLPADKASLILSSNGSVVLTNLLPKLRHRIEEIDKNIVIAAKETEGLFTLHTAYTKQATSGSSHDVALHLHDVHHQSNELRGERSALSTQLVRIDGALRESGAPSEVLMMHTFKPTAFALPKSCDLCKTSLWGTSRHGLTCTECGYNCHSKCELKVPPDCSRVPKSRSKTQNSRPASIDEGVVDTLSIAVALYDYNAQNDDELSFKAGDRLNLLGNEQSGWLRGALAGKQGWVPLTYIDRQSTMRAVRRAQALYDYKAQTADELSMRAGNVMDVMEEDKGDGWCEVRIQGKIGCVPATYIQ